MLYMSFALGFFMAAAILLFAFRSTSIHLTPVEDWKDLWKYLSVQIAAATGALVTAIPIIDSMKDQYPALAAIVDSHAYHLVCSALAFATILGRAVKQGKDDAPPAAPAAEQPQEKQK